MSKTRHSASVSRYANALFHLAQEAKVLDSISNDLDKIIGLLISDKEFSSSIKHPSIMSNYHIKHLEEYFQVYRKSVNQPEAFWEEIAEENFMWRKKWNAVVDWDF
mgnify:CR=1 FL=1